MIDLNPNHLSIVEGILAEHVPDCEVRAFGSRATWNAKDYSDIDVAIVGDGPLDWRTLGRLKESFEESNLPMRVDVLDWHAISESFRKVIKREYVVVREGPKRTGTGEWQMCTLGELTDNFDATRIPVKESDRRSGPYPYFGASGIVDHVDGFLFDGEYLLIAEDGENLRTRTTPIAFLANGKFWVNNHAHIMQGNRNADTRFLKYALSVLDISGYLTGSTMPKLTQGNMNRITLLTPPLPTQRAIAHVLGTLDDKIELNRRMNETLEAMARALFKSWFVDFEPVRAKMEGRWRRGESLPGLPADLYDLFPDRLAPSELGEIPEGWEVRTVGDIATLHRNNENPARSPSTIFSHFSIPAYDAGQIPIRQLGESIKSAKSQVPQDTVLLSKLNPEIKRVWLVDVVANERAICSTEFLVLEAKPPFQRGYVYCLALSPFFRQQIASLVTGTSRSHQRVSANAMFSLEKVVPPAQVVEIFEMYASERLNRGMSCRRESNNLAALRDTLLPQLVSGEVEIASVRMISK